MKITSPHALFALVSASIAATCPVFADRLPAEVMDPEMAALYQQRLEEGLSFITTEPDRTPAELKMSAQLASLFNAGLRPAGAGVEVVKAEMLRLGQIRSQSGQPDEMHVYVHVTGPAALDAVRLRMVGWVDADPAWPMDEWPMLAGWVQESRLVELASLDDVRFIQAVDPPRFRTGTVTSAGDALHNGPLARGAPLNVNGSGIRVGVISDGISNLPLAQASGDLPAVNVLNPGSGDEGTAMLEIIHDLAPGAMLDFCSSGSSKSAFGNAIAALALGGCNIICDDVGWYDDPYFEHSPLGTMISNLRAQYGFLHVSAAGNDAEVHHQQIFTDVNPPGGNSEHDAMLLVGIPSGGVLDVFMKWKEPQPVPPASLVSDYDLFLVDFYNTATEIKSSKTRNVPEETIYYTNSTPNTIYALVAVRRYSGTIRHDLEIFIEPQNGSWHYTTNPVSAVDAIFGHPGHGSVISVVSTDAANPTAIEPDCSQGPFTILGPLQPTKPDLAGIDGVAVTGAGGFPTPFFGTSAAAPHVAGVLALVWSRSPGADDNAIKASLILPQPCLDLGTTGFDTVFGHGRPLADQWALLINQTPTISVPSGTFECAQMISENITGVTVNDLDAGGNAVKLTLSAAKGMVQINPTIQGGLTPLQITPTIVNGSPGFIATAPILAIQTTLAAANGLAYLPNPVPMPPGTPVSDTLAFSLDDQGNSGVGGSLLAAGTVALQVHQYAFDAWRYDHFSALELGNPLVSGNLANPDGDLHANVWEYFMGTAPKTADAERSPSTTVSAGNLVFTFRLSKDIAGNAYAVKVSQDLVNWANVPAGQITTPWPQHPTAPDAWLMEVKRPLSANTKDFIRVEFDPRP